MHLVDDQFKKGEGISCEYNSSKMLQAFYSFFLVIKRSKIFMKWLLRTYLFPESLSSSVLCTIERASQM